MHVLKYLLTLQSHHELIILNDQDHCKKIFQYGASEVIMRHFLYVSSSSLRGPLQGSLTLYRHHSVTGWGISVASDNNFFFKLPSSITSFKSRPLWKKISSNTAMFQLFFTIFFFAFSFFFYRQKQAKTSFINSFSK